MTTQEKIDILEVVHNTLQPWVASDMYICHIIRMIMIVVDGNNCEESIKALGLLDKEVLEELESHSEIKNFKYNAAFIYMPTDEISHSSEVVHNRNEWYVRHKKRHVRIAIDHLKKKLSDEDAQE